jgi:periplasmic divalent cation tolerance protein
MTDYVSVYMTAGSEEEADRISAALVAEGLAACVNILGTVRSVYRWEGAIQRESETAFVAKTQAALFDALSARVRELHSYDVPCIVAWPISQGEPEYLAWIGEESGKRS